MSIEAMKEALEFIDSVKVHPTQIATRDALHTTLRTAIAEAEKQEPVAWVYEWDGRKHLTFTDQRFVEQAHPHFNKSTPLYAAPRQWVGLTDEEIAAVTHGSVEGERMLPYQYARAISEKLKQKNEAT